MNVLADMQDRIAKVLESPDVLPTGIPVVRWRKKNMQSDMEATMAVQDGLCVFVPMPIPLHALQGTPFVFFDKFECRVQIVEMPNTNQRDVDLYEMIEIIALALHWQPKSVGSPLAGILAHPLYLAERPVELAEGLMEVPGFERNGDYLRAADLVFNAALQINQTTNQEE